MVVPTTTNKTFATGNGVLVDFDFSFKYFESSEIFSQLDGEEVDQSDFTVTMDPSGNGGTVTYDTAPGNGVQILIYRQLPYTQEIRVPDVGSLSKEKTETAYDRSAMLAQQNKEAIDRALKLPISFEEAIDLTYPPPEAGKAVIWNETEDGFTNSNDVVNNITTAAQASADASASSAASASASASAASSSESAAASSASSANASAIAAAASAAEAEAIVGLSAASVTEQLAGTSTTKYSTPDSVAALWEQGADITATSGGSLITLPSTGGGIFEIVSANNVQNITTTGIALGRQVAFLITDASMAFITGGNLDIPDDITCAVGDVAVFRLVDNGSTFWALVSYMKQDGTPLKPTYPVATQSQQETGTSLVTTVPPGRQHFHPSAGKAFVLYNTVTTTSILTSYNVSSLTDNGTGNTSINFATAFTSANYSPVGMSQRTAAGTSNTTCEIDKDNDPTASVLRVVTTINASVADVPRASIHCMGDV